MVFHRGLNESLSLPMFIQFVIVFLGYSFGYIIVHSLYSFQRESSDNVDLSMVSVREQKHSFRGKIIRRDEAKDNKKVTEAIVLTYIRAGSSLVGESLNHHEKSFYLFEPSSGILFHANTTRGIYRMYEDSDEEFEQNADSDITTFARNWNEINTLSERISDLLSCRFDSVKPVFFTTDFVTKSLALGEFHYCYGNRLKEKKNCQHLFQEGCLMASIRAVKEVWLNVSDTDGILRKNPSLKVIHLLRDPRAMLLSRIRSGIFDGVNIANYSVLPHFAKEMCATMHRNMEAERLLRQKYPNAFYTLYYEDYVKDFVEQTHQLYDFLGSDLGGRTRAWLESIAEASKRDGRYNTFHFGTLRTDPVQISEDWKMKLDPDIIYDIDRECKDFYDVSRYNAYPPNSDPSSAVTMSLAD